MKTRIVLTLALLPLIASAAPFQRGLGNGAANPRRPADCPMHADCPLESVALASPTTLSAEQLVFAVEEERVAHDLYVVAAQRWNLPAFERIAQAEIRHQAAISKLAASINAPLPATQPGVYATAELQQLYTSLLPLVNGSIEGALKAGALIEETDVADLRRMIAAVSDEPTRAVLGHLETASSNHLAAFVGILARRGITYTPEVLSAEDYAELLSSARAGRGGMGRGRGRWF